MATIAKIVAPFVVREPINLLKEHGMLATTGPRDSWDDTNADPAKGILYGVLMGSLLWSAILLLIDVFRG